MLARVKNDLVPALQCIRYGTIRDAVIERALAVGREGGVAIGMGARTPEQLRQNIERGFTMVGYGPDYAMLLNAARAGLDAFERPG